MRAKLILCRALAYAGAAYVAGCCCALIFFIVSHGLPVLGPKLFFGDTPALDAILGLRPVWDGIWPALAGTLCLVVLTTLMAALPGICFGLYLARFAKGRVKERLSLGVDLLASVPSIVMGLFGFVLILAFCMALLVMPSLVVSTRSSVESLPPALYFTGAALGLTEGQILRRLLVPAAARGILGGLMLAMGRAAEDTAVIMLTGVVVNSGMPAGLGAKFEALPFLIYYTAAQYMDESELLRGFGAALVLLMLSALLMGAAWLCQRSMERRWKGIR